MNEPTRSLLGAAAATFDRAVVAAIRMRARARGSRVEQLPHDERMRKLAAIRAAYGAPELGASPDAFFPRRAPIEPRVDEARTTMRDVRVLDLAWPSEVVPHLPAVRDKYLSHEANRTARARLYLGPTPRPAVVLIHGYLAGQWAVEERAWPIRWLTRKYDVALTLLPFHALRARTDRRGAPPFPGADPRFTNEGFRQAIIDIRALIAHLRARGAPSVGVMGMSLGGYTTSLLSTIDPDLAFAAPIIPLASVADFALEQGRLGHGESALAQRDALEEATRIVSPFARPSLVPRGRMMILAAEADHITPIAHAERLARYFDARMVRFTGGHLLQFGRAEAFRALGSWLAQLRDAG
jgi:dienelactone hydrolase